MVQRKICLDNRQDQLSRICFLRVSFSSLLQCKNARTWILLSGQLRGNTIRGITAPLFFGKLIWISPFPLCKFRQMP